ncbi:5'-nucleotidase domain-containing protein 2-like [Mustelus asterias]
MLGQLHHGRQILTHLFSNSQDAIAQVHIKGFMYKWIMEDLEKYILRGEETFAVLQHLVHHGKKLFLITNSPFSFVDKGMSYMVGKDWRDLFDVVIVQADKPHFFNDCIKGVRHALTLEPLTQKLLHLERGPEEVHGNDPGMK